MSEHARERSEQLEYGRFAKSDADGGFRREREQHIQMCK
jgi:hypothetical protein